MNKTRHIQHVSYRSTTINMLFFLWSAQTEMSHRVKSFEFARKHFCIIKHIYILSWSTIVIVLSMMMMLMMMMILSFSHSVYVNEQFSAYLLRIKKKKRRKGGGFTFIDRSYLSIEDYTHTKRVESSGIFRSLPTHSSYIEKIQSMSTL